MTHTPDIDFEIDPFTYLGATIGNAFHSGLSLEDVYNALRVTDDARTGDRTEEEKVFERFDGVVSTTINLRNLTQNRQEDI